MRVSELAEQTGVSVSTIKYYVREGLLPPGNRLGERRASYDQRHVARLRLLRALREVGGVSVSDLKTIVLAIDDESRTVHQMFGAAFDALTRSAAQPVTKESLRDADELVDRVGWTRVRSISPERRRLAEILQVIDSIGADIGPLRKTVYYELVDAIAALEVDRLDPLDPTADRDTLVRRMVVGQVLLGEFLLSLRRLAHEHHSASRSARPDGAAPAPPPDSSAKT